MKIFLAWSDFKTRVASKSKLRFVDRDSFYYIYYQDEGGFFETSILKDSGSDQTDFEANYQSSANKSSEPQADSDNAYIQRNKIAPTGWTYQLRAIEVETSLLDSVYNKKADLSNWGDATVKFYNGSGTELTDQSVLDTDCVKTVLDFEPAYDFEIIGGFAKILADPTNPIRIWVIAVPDVPEAYGGSKLMVSGVDFRFIGTTDKVEADGRASKRMNYSASLHTNKLRVIFAHAAGEKHKLLIGFEHYKL